LEVVFASKTVEERCANLKSAKKLVGGSEKIALGILSRINALRQAPTIKDIIVQPQFRFHNLDDRRRKKLRGFFAIDVTNRRCPWRIILQPLDSNKKAFDPCNIDEISDIVEIVQIIEVSNHYE